MIVVDTSALIAILQVEPDAQALAAAMQSSPAVAMSAVTLLETGIVIQSRRGPAGVDDLTKLLSGTRVMTVPFDERMAVLAIEAFARFGRGGQSGAKLNFGDCASYALAKSLDAPLLFKGNDFTATDIVSAV